MEHDDKTTLTQLFADAADEIIELWLRGLSLRQAAERLFLPGDAVYYQMHRTETNRLKMQAAREVKALQLVDEATSWAATSGQKGAEMYDAQLINIGVNHNMKLASKLAPKDYGDKSQLELTGGIHVDQDITLSPAEAYEQMINR